MQKIIAAAIMIAALAVAGTAGAETWTIGETRPGLGQFGIGDTVTDPGAGTSFVIPPDASIVCTFRGEPGDALRVIDPQTASDALSLAYLARFRQMYQSYAWVSDLDLPGYRLVYHAYGNEAQWFMARPLQSAGLPTYDLDNPATQKVTAVGDINIIAGGVKYTNVDARQALSVGTAFAESLTVFHYEAFDEWPEQWGIGVQINLAGLLGACNAGWTSPTPPPPPTAPTPPPTSNAAPAPAGKPL